MISRSTTRFFFFTFLTLFSTYMVGNLPAQNLRQQAPPDAPAQFKWDGVNFQLRYNNGVVFEGKIENPKAITSFNKVVSNDNGKVDQVFKWFSDNKPLKMVGTIGASDESFPCEAEPRPDAPVIVCNSYGLSHSLLNRAIYDRKSDWLVSVDFPSRVVIVPTADKAGNKFSVEITGNNIMLRFRPRFYQKHRGLKYYAPWTYNVWKKSVAGWSSWFAYMDKITQKNVEKTADVLSKELLPYGLKYLQIDDGYERQPVGTPKNWLTPNSKFPDGLAKLSRYISADGLTPGIWTNVSFQDEAYADAHKDLFVRNNKGNLAYGQWIGYIMDGSNPETLDSLVIPVYKGLKQMGWGYYKVDALRHLRYEGYNTYSDYFRKKGLNRVQIYRKFLRTIRDEIGKNSFMLGCWGIRPALVGIINACRVGTDGFGLGGFSEYNSYNNVVWRNDPDHIQLTSKEAYADCMVTSLTGSLFMVTDKPEVYKTPVVEAARRSIPILFTQPGQVYDVNPTRSDKIDMVNTALSGSGPRPFDADQRSYCDLYELEINKPFEDWVVLGRIADHEKSIRFADLGLDPGKDYVVFEFWTGKYLGSFKGGFDFPTIDPRYNCQLFCIREKADHPQLLATNRHVSCGGYDLTDVAWRDKTLSGKSRLVGGDDYRIYIREPQVFHFASVSCSGAKVTGNSKTGEVRIIELRAAKNGSAAWKIRYE